MGCDVFPSNCEENDLPEVPEECSLVICRTQLDILLKNLIFLPFIFVYIYKKYK